MIGTAAEKEELERRYPQNSDIADYAGEFSSENLEGDNDTFVVMLSCAYDMDVNFSCMQLILCQNESRKKR